MASSKDYLLYVLELLREVNNVTYKKMMGEFMLYSNGILFGGVYDNRFLIKKTKSLEGSGLKEQIPYPSAKAMLLIDIEDKVSFRNMFPKIDLRFGEKKEERNFNLDLFDQVDEYYEDLVKYFLANRAFLWIFFPIFAESK